MAGMKPIENYLKPLAQLLFTVLSVILTSLVDGEAMTRVDWINVTITGFGAIMVLGAGNFPEGVWRYTKAILSAAIAALVTIHSVWATGGNLDTSHWISIVLAALATLGVYGVKGPYVEPLSPAAAAQYGRHHRGN